MSQAPLSAAQIPAALSQALAFHQQGQPAQAEQWYRRILAAQPQHADALHYLGVLYLQCQHPQEGADLIRQSLDLQPDQPSVYLSLGNALIMLGRLDEAVEVYDQLLQRMPGYADAHNNKAQALMSLKRPQDALAACDAALGIDARMPQSHCLRGHALRALARHAEALAAFQQATQLVPAYAEAHMGRGLVLAALGQRAAAIEAFRQVIALTPEDVEAHNNLGVMQLELSMLDEAAQTFTKVLQLQPAHTQAQANLGVTYLTQGRHDEAVRCFKHALELDPGNHVAQSQLLYALSFTADCSPAEYLTQARHFGDLLGASAHPFQQWPAAQARTPDQPLRVGLVSGDLRFHSVGHFLEQFLAQLAQRKVELVAYATQPIEDELTARIRAHCQLWRSVHGLDDASLASLIRDDGVQILVDLAGHTAHNRLPVFAWKPAPVQLSWLGYLASTGVPGMDYLLADEVTVPSGHEAHFTETVWRLPDTANCFTPPGSDADLPVGDLPARHNGHLTFGCFQSVSKLSDDTLLAWADILRALPESRLRIQSKTLAQSSDQDALRVRLQRLGLPSERVSLQGPLETRTDVLKQYQQIDMVLDTFHYPGITTTCEALWMGVPTLTLAGQTLLSRQGASLLRCAGLPDWIAQSPTDYVTLALAHARDLDALGSVRARLRDQVLRSPLFDAPRFAMVFEEALRRMWQRHLDQPH